MSGSYTHVIHPKPDEIIHLQLRVKRNSSDEEEEEEDKLITVNDEEEVEVYAEGDGNKTDESDDGSVNDDEEEEEVDSVGDENETDESDDGSVTDVTLLVMLHLQLVAYGIIQVDEMDDEMYEGVADLFMEPDDEDDDEGEMYHGLIELFREPDYMDELLHRVVEIRQQYVEGVLSFVFHGCQDELTNGVHLMLRRRIEDDGVQLERMGTRRLEFQENIIKIAFEYKNLYG